MEYKFRAWDKVKNKMYEYGTDEARELWEEGCDMMGMSFISCQPNIEWMQFTGLYDSTKWEELTDFEKKEFLELHRFEDGVKAIHNTVDEVKHLWQGREIYEGDILRLWRSVGSKGDLRGEYYKPLEVKYCTGWASFVVVDFENKEQFIVQQSFDVFKVIGNAHDNPELLEGKENG